MRLHWNVTVLALSATFLLGACSSSESSSPTAIAATAAAADTTALATPVTADGVAAALTASFKEASGTTLTDEQTSCATKSILSAFTEKELTDLGKSTGGFDALSDADKAKAVGSFQKCPGVLEEALFSVFQQSAPGLDETQGRCGVTAISKAFTPDELAQLSSSPAAAQNPEVLTKVFNAFETCDGLLRSLLAGGLKQSAGLTEKQATCAADAMIKELGPETSVKLITDPTSVDPAAQAKLVAALGACTK